MDETQQDSQKSKADAPEGLKTSELALGNHCRITTNQTDGRRKCFHDQTKGIPLAPGEIIVGEREEHLSSLQRGEEEEMLKVSPVHQTTTSPLNIQGHHEFCFRHEVHPTLQLWRAERIHQEPHEH